MAEQFELNRKIDLICDAFEQAWARDSNTCAEAFLQSGTEDVDRSRLLEALLLVELELRNRHGGLPPLEEMRLRFPNDSDVVLAAYRDAESFARDRLLPQKLGPYRIQEELGRGTFGTVYRSWDTKLHRFVALKVLHPWYSESKLFVDNFRREAQAAAGLNHPNICLVLDHGCAGAWHYYAMQYCEGPSLARYLAENERMPASDAVTTIIELAAALHEAHQRGIIHRDLKPANILLQQKGRPLITDFGLAQTPQDNPHADPLIIAGTPAYMAPEQRQGGVQTTTVCPRLDVYSLGAMLFEMLTGSSPARIPNHSPGRENYLNSVLRRYAGPGIVDVCQRALSLRAVDRYASAAEFALALQGVADRRQRTTRVASIAGGILVIGALLFAAFHLSQGSLGKSALSTNPSEDGEAVRGQRLEYVAEVYENDWDQPLIPVSEWLRGREVLTVSLDGEADFRNISDALASVRPHQVVQVLDQGPYRENLSLDRMPSDTGLVSLVGTTIAPRDWKRWKQQTTKPIFEGCHVSGIVGFRLSGFEFVAPPFPPDGNADFRLVRLRAVTVKDVPIPLTIENCRFRRTSGETSAQDRSTSDPKLIALDVTTTRNAAPLYLERCYVGGQLGLDVYTPGIIARNVIASSNQESGVCITPGYGQILVIRDNVVFANRAIRIGIRRKRHIHGLEGVFSEPSIQLVNNFLAGETAISTGIRDRDAKGFEIPLAKLEGNLFWSAAAIRFDEPEDLARAAEVWDRSRNCQFGRSTQVAGTLLSPGVTDWQIQREVSPPATVPDGEQVAAILRQVNEAASAADWVGPHVDENGIVWPESDARGERVATDPH